MIIGENWHIHNPEEAGILVIRLILGIVVLLGGHAFGLLLGAFSAFIHAARLQFVEFFSKFYKAGVKEYQPFRYNGTYYEIKS
jgi:V/A-type H+-transporting ATPase subunit I